MGAGVLAQAPAETVLHERGQGLELTLDGNAVGFAFADLLARVVLGAAEGVDGVLQLPQALWGHAVVFEGFGVGGSLVVDVLGGVGEGGGAQVQQGAVAVVGGVLQGAVLLVDGVGVHVAGHFAGTGGE